MSISSGRATIRDLVYWVDPKASGAVLACGLVAFFVVGGLGWSSLGSACMLLSLMLLARLVYYSTVGTRPQTPETFFAEEEVQAYLTTATASANSAARAAYALATAEDPAFTLQCAAGLAAVAYVCRLVGTTGLFFLCFVAAFSLPKVYELKQAEADAAFEMLRAKVTEGYQAALARMPSIPKAAGLKAADEAEKKKL